MIGQLRGKVGGYIVVAIIGFIAMVFAFEGVFRPSSTNGLHEGAVAGVVNGESITIGDYNRALEQKMEFFKGMVGGNLTEEQMKMFRLREGVFQELVQQKLMTQAALSSGRTPSDEAVRQQIVTLPYFQRDGKFDPAQYRATLEANRFSTAMFEKMIREQLAIEDWSRSFSNQIRVSDAEVKEEFASAGNLRSYKIVSIPTAVSEAGMSAKEAAEKAASLMKPAKASDAAVNAVLKPFNVTVREIEAASSGSLAAGVQDHPELAKDLFGEEGLKVGQSKIYESPARVTVVLVTSAQKPDLAKLQASKTELQSRIRARKERELMNAVMKQLTEKAKIESNQAVIGESSGAV
jgi:hypothetical protein